MNITQLKTHRRWRRHRHLRHKLSGTAGQPRLVVFRSLKHIYAQLIDDEAGRTLASSSTMAEPVKAQAPYGGNVSAAKLVGGAIAKKALELGIKRVAFDRGGFKYHGRVKALADAAREGGLEF
jgi:large subunit ribosomal protein L18